MARLAPSDVGIIEVEVPNERAVQECGETRAGHSAADDGARPARTFAHYVAPHFFDRICTDRSDGAAERVEYADAQLESHRLIHVVVARSA